MKTVIYLAGPISGPLLPENRKRFYDVEAKVLAHWFGRVEKVILNPATLPLGLTEQDYINSLKVLKAINWLNKWFSWTTIFIRKNKKPVKKSLL